MKDEANAYVPHVVASRAKAYRQQRDPKRDAERRAKISAALIGKPKNEAHKLNVGRAKRGVKASNVTQAMMSATHKWIGSVRNFGEMWLGLRTRRSG